MSRVGRDLATCSACAAVGCRLGLQGTAAADGTVLARVTFDRSAEGAPGFVHGGQIAVVFDEVLANVQLGAGRTPATTTLTVNFRRPVPLDVELRVVARCDGPDGNRWLASAELRRSDTDDVLASASGRFAEVRR